MTHIRPLQPDDLPAVQEMIGLLSAHHDDTATLTLADMQRDMLGDAPWIRVLVAQDGDTLIGYAALLPLSRIHLGLRNLDINHMFVRDGYRGQGVGRALLAGAHQVARTLGCTNLFIGTAPENSDAQAAYLTMGFEAHPSGGPRFRMAVAGAAG